MPPARGGAAGAAGKKRGRGGKAAAGHQLAPQFPSGTILTDTQKQTWKLGKAVGSGGFGLIYLASPADSSGEPQYVLKVEPHGNGPLFCELNFYQRVAKTDQINSWISSERLKFLGVPKFIATGRHEYKGTMYRFMVMERFGTDLQKLFEENGKTFSRIAVYQLAIKMLNALEYIHKHQYAHADIKASNILMGFRKGTQDEVYLVDYGLAFRYESENGHKEYKEDPKRRHDGTIEFTSRDAHRGVAPARRSDIEILGYCLLQWLCGQLPWENRLTDKDYVAAQKEKYMKDIPGLMKTCFPGGNIPGEMEKYLKEAVNLKYDKEPNYTKLRQLFSDGLKKLGSSPTAKLDLSTPNSTAAAKTSRRAPAKKPSSKRRSEVLDEDTVESDDEYVERQKANGDAPRSMTPRKPRGGSARRGRPAASARSPSPRKVQSPAISRVKAQAAVNGKGEPLASVATQTSPGLRGLKRSRKR